MNMRQGPGDADEDTCSACLTLLRRPGALIITVIAASDVAYRLLLRASIRRGLGMQD